MRVAGITPSTVQPTDGVMRSNANGEPLGVFVESARQLITAQTPTMTDRLPGTDLACRSGST